MFLEKRIIKNNITVDKEIEIGSQPSYVIKFTDSDNCSSSLALYEEELKDLLMALQNISEKPENSVTDFQTFYMVGYTDIPVFEERNLKSYTFIEQEFWEYKEAREYVKNAKEKQTYCIAQVTYKYYSGNSQPEPIENTYKILTIIDEEKNDYDVSDFSD